MSLLTPKFLAFLNARPSRRLAPAPPAPPNALCGHCDVPHAEHGVRYSAIPGWHTWVRAGWFLPLSDSRRRFPHHRTEETPND